LIMESLARLREYPIHRRTALRAVLSEDGHAFFPQYEFLKSLAPMGFRAFSIEPDLLVSGLSEKLRGDGFYSLRESFRAAAEDYRQSLSEKMFFRFENLSVGIERLQKRCKKTSRCSPGRDRISVDPEGMLLACPTGLGAPQNVMGNINEGYDPECQILWDASGPLSAKKLCADCWAAPLCGGNCRALSLRKGNGMNEPEPVYCLFTKMCLEYAMWLMSTVEPRTMETMLHGYRNECEVGHANAL
jgi:radical SAM protein with 4Fe4S-binding SPASM domain